MHSFGSMFVWIPRYIYKITSGLHSSTTGKIGIKWSNNTQDNTSDGYAMHPAFNFGGQELKGIWVAKFEASNSSSYIKVVPNVYAWCSMNVASIFTTCRNMEKTDRYGWATQGGTLNTDGSITGDSNSFDTHMMKNMEWGAMAYLTHSIGKTGEIWMNPDSNHTTGRAGTFQSQYWVSSTTPYNTAYGVHASTTDNVYGIYDVAGGAYEYVMGVLGTTIGSSGFSSLPATKYYDSYLGNSSDSQANYELNSKKGDAIYEISSSGTNVTRTCWYSDISVFVNKDNAWFMRGANCDTSDSGIFEFKPYVRNRI
jgi:hypothetical protein